jgi:hypothetical protein
MPAFSDWQTLSSRNTQQGSADYSGRRQQSRDWPSLPTSRQILIPIARPLYAADPIGVDLDHSV